MRRDSKAILRYTTLTGHKPVQVGETRQYRLNNNDGVPVSYAHVEDMYRTIASAFPVTVKCKDIVSLFDKRLNPVVIWACEDGIIYARVEDIRGDILVDRTGSELVAVYPKQKSFKYLRYYEHRE